MTTALSKKSDYLWWLIFFLSFYSAAFIWLFQSNGDARLGLGLGSLSFPTSVGTSWLIVIMQVFLVSFITTLPLLLPRYWKYFIALFSLVFGFFLYSIVTNSKEDTLWLVFLVPYATFWFGAFLALFVLFPLFVQRHYNLASGVGSIIASGLIIVGIIAALFVSSITVYAARLAAALPQPQACERMEQVSQYLSPWRHYFRDQCPVGTGEELSFPTISDEALLQHITQCDVQRLFSSRESHLSGLCLKDGSGYLTTNEAMLDKEIHKVYHPEWPVDCKYGSSLAFQFLNSEQEVLAKLQQLCQIPTSQ